MELFLRPAAPPRTAACPPRFEKQLSEYETGAQQFAIGGGDLRAYEEAGANEVSLPEVRKQIGRSSAELLGTPKPATHAPAE